MSLVMKTPNSSTASRKPADSEKVEIQTVAGESTIKLLKPSGLTGISTSDYVELRNYIYGVNGRY